MQIIGWGLFVPLSFPLKTLFYDSVIYAVGLSLLREPVGFLLTSSFRYVFRWGKVTAEKPLRVTAFVFPLSFAAAGLDLLVGVGVARAVGAESAKEQIFGPYLFRVLLFLVWCVLYLGIKSLLRSQERKLALSRAETAARDAEILMLRAQVSPHFLFNAFNTIMAEFDGTNPKLLPVVRGLSDYFRYSLANRDAVLVTMGEEYDAIMSYLTVEKARFEDSLIITSSIDPAVRSMSVPGVFLQPLLENALKYGHMTSPTPLRVRLEIRSTPEGALVEVANSGKWIEPVTERTENDPGGNGLSVLGRRLDLLYPGNHSLEIDPCPGKGEVSIRLRLPFRIKPQNT